MPVRLSEALNSCARPLQTEQQASRAERAKSRVQGILAAIKNVGFVHLCYLQRLLRPIGTKRKRHPESDKKLLEDQQKAIGRRR
jgi:hypothetical protein